MFWDNIFNAKKDFLDFIRPSKFQHWISPQKVPYSLRRYFFFVKSSFFGYLFLKRPGWRHARSAAWPARFNSWTTCAVEVGDVPWGRTDSLQGNTPLGSFPQIVMKITHDCTWLTSLELIWQKKILKIGKSFKPKGWKVLAMLKISVVKMFFSSISRSRHLPKQFWGWAYETKSLWVGWFPFPFISFETLRYQKKKPKRWKGGCFFFFSCN